MKYSVFSAVVSAASLFVAFHPADAGTGISYPAPEWPYLENFDHLPLDAPTLASIETVYVNGWQDDDTTVANDHVSVPGWYLYHPLSPALENGTNGHQRIRFGAGANTGGFWAFKDPGTPDEMALGSIGSLTVASDPPDPVNMFIGLRLVNNTGSTLGSFTVTFDGEQWRDGASPNGETMTCAYSLTAQVADWFATAAFTPIPSLSFTSPVFTGTAASGTTVNGNAAGLVPGLTATITGITWAPGTELWLRWTDPQLANAADDGLAIDNFRFTASLAPPGIPDANLTVTKNGTGQLQLEWQGNSTISYQVQHSADLQTWINQTAPAPETDGKMTFVIPPDLLVDKRRFFRLHRTRP